MENEGKQASNIQKKGSTAKRSLWKKLARNSNSFSDNVQEQFVGKRKLVDEDGVISDAEEFLKIFLKKMIL